MNVTRFRWLGWSAATASLVALSALFWSGDEVDVPRYPVGAYPSTKQAQRALGRTAAPTVLSVALAPEDWDGSDRGIRAHSKQRGRQWQRVGSVSLFARGALVDESTVAVRIHGDSSRSLPEKSLRLGFRSDYGSSVSPADLLPGAAGRWLVAHNDRRDRCFVNPISYEIAGRLGCNVPLTRPTRVVVNGELLENIYFLTERLSRSFFEQSFGDRAWLLVNEKKGFAPKGERYRRDRLMLEREGVTFEEVAARIDIDGVIDWLTSVLFLGSFDACQGIAYVDPDGDGCWRWVMWDLDHSLKPWHHDDFASVASYLLHPGRDLRTLAFQVLMPRDGEFRRRLLRRVSRALNHELTPTFLGKLLARYEVIADEFGGGMIVDDSLRGMRDFLSDRPAAMRRELQSQFGLGAVRHCKLRLPLGACVRIDDFSYDRDWRGEYYDGQSIDVWVTMPGLELRVNGEPVPSNRLQREVTEDLSIEVVRR